MDAQHVCFKKQAYLPMRKFPLQNPGGEFQFLRFSLSAISIAIISPVGLPVSPRGPVVAGVGTLRYPALDAGPHIPVVVLPNVVVRAGIMCEPVVANA